MHKNFILPEGLSGRLSFNITNNGDPATAELAGAVFGEGGAKIPFQAVQADRPVLITPRMPAGLHRYEIRAGACPVLYGHLEVFRSPLADTPGERQWTIDVDVSAEVAVLHIELNEGATGPQGPQGEQGDSAYDIWLAAGNTGTQQDFLDSLRGADGEDGAPGVTPTAEQMQAAASGMIYETSVTQHRSIEGSGNASLHWLQLDARRVPVGKLQAISIPCRDTAGAEAPGPQALYLTLWELSVNGVDWVMLGSSTEAVQQVVNETSRWEFEGIELSGRKFRICAAAEPNVWDESQWLGVRTASREDGEDSRIVGHSHVNVVTDVTFEMTSVTPRFAAAGGLAEHTQDAVAHVTAEERARWDATAASGAVSGNVGSQLKMFSGDGVKKLEVNAMTGGINATCLGRAGFALDTPILFNWVEKCVFIYSGRGTSKNIWFMAGRDITTETDLGPFESGVYVGDENYPLRLRGSNVSINGVTVDAAALAQLVAHKDELLALLESSAANETST